MKKILFIIMILMITNNVYAGDDSQTGWYYDPTYGWCPNSYTYIDENGKSRLQGSRNYTYEADRKEAERIEKEKKDKELYEYLRSVQKDESKLSEDDDINVKDNDVLQRKEVLNGDISEYQTYKINGVEMSASDIVEQFNKKYNRE